MDTCYLNAMMLEDLADLSRANSANTNRWIGQLRAEVTGQFLDIQNDVLDPVKNLNLAQTVSATRKRFDKLEVEVEACRDGRSNRLKWRVAGTKFTYLNKSTSESVPTCLHPSNRSDLIGRFWHFGVKVNSQFLDLKSYAALIYLPYCSILKTGDSYVGYARSTASIQKS